MDEKEAEKIDFLHDVYDKVITNPNWYVDVVNTAGAAFTQFKKGLDTQESQVLMALMFLTPKQAQKIQKRMNRDMWHRNVQQAIDLRAEGKGLGSFNSKL